MSDIETMAHTAETMTMQGAKSRERLEESLAQVVALLQKHRLVESLVHSQDNSRRHDLVESLVHRQNLAELRSRLHRMHTADVGYVLEALPPAERILVWNQIAEERRSDILLEVSEAVRKSVIDAMERDDLKAIVEALDADDLADIAEEIPEEILQRRLQSLNARERQWLQTSMTYPEDSVGDLMSSEMVTVRDNLTLARALESLRRLDELPIHTDKLFVVDGRRMLRGVLPLQALLLGEPEALVADTMAVDVVSFTPDDDAHGAAQAFERYDLVSAPVINERGRLVGRLTVDVVMDFLREESQEEVLNLAGLAHDEDLFSNIWSSARNRWLWLSINLCTAFVASRVVGLFESAIAQIVALAALMPIVAGIGGNTGNQTTALIIRGLALGQINRGNLKYLVRKELGIAVLNGLVWGSVVGLFAYTLYDSASLGLVIASAVLLTLIIAAIVGMAVPLTLEKMGRDPALGSSVLLTATTDSMGFFIFLGLASLFLL